MSPPPNYNLSEPWARQPFEDDRAWALFSAYLATPAGARSIREIAQRHNVPWTQVEILALEHGWEVRAGLWDENLDRLRRETIEREVQEDARSRASRHLRTLRKASDIVEAELNRRLELVANGGPVLMSDANVSRLLERVIKLERLVAGDQDPATDVNISLDGLSVDELRNLREIQEKVRK